MSDAENANRCRILLVDDDAQFRGFICRFLVKNEFTPLEAADASTGLAMVKQEQPDLILCDLEMPGMDGYEFLARVQQDPVATTIPVIFLTGRSDLEEIRFGMNLGADDYLTKPVSLEDLARAIQTRLARSKQRRDAVLTDASARLTSALEKTFLVKTSREQRLVKVRDISRIIAYGEYSWIYWEASKGAMLRKSLKQWMAELPSDQFVRVHRGAIVNLSYLDKVEKLSGGQTFIHVRNATEPIPVSLRLAPELNRKLRRFRSNTKGPGPASNE
jgi:DNA-binding LytR/AlgR family response regulator